MGAPLAGRRIVVPESRELDLFAAMLERQGAEVVRCPLVTILDLEEADAGALDGWLRRLAEGGFDVLVFYTGEGVTRMVARAERLGLHEAAIAALSKAQKIVRGPKPVGALRRLGLTADLAAGEPTTEGLAALMRTLPLEGRRVGVQLFPDHKAEPVLRVLAEGGASVEAVIPYRYVKDEGDERVAAAIREMAAGRVDLIAFTSTPQVRRLVEVSARLGLGGELERAFAATRIAAVGPVTAEAVTQAGGRVAVEPQASFHLKPLVGEIVRALAPA